MPLSPPYHRLARAPALRRVGSGSQYAPWKPALEGLLAAALWVGLLMGYMIAFLYLWQRTVGLVTDRPNPLALWDSGPEADRDPAVLLLSYGSVAATLPAPFVAAWIVGRTPGALWSITSRLRWDVLGTAVCWIALPAAAFYLLEALAHGGVPTGRTPWFAAALTTSLILIPLQSAAEECLFRGTLPQAFGAWFRAPIAAYGCALPFFVGVHSYGVVGLTVVGLFGAWLSFLAYRTGGLEASIVLHAVNNLSVSYVSISGVEERTTEAALIAALLYQAGAVCALVALRHLAPKKVGRPGWFPGPGWYRGWPLVARLRSFPGA